MVHELDVLLRDLIGYHENQISDLDVEWGYAEQRDEGPAHVGFPVLVYRDPDGNPGAEPLTEAGLRRYRDALLADLLQLGSPAPDELEDEERPLVVVLDPGRSRPVGHETGT